MASMDSISEQITALSKELKSLAKIVRKVRAHQEDPTGEKAKERASRSGFNRLQKVSPQLGAFLGLGEGDGVSRGEVTKRINAYVKEKNLKHPDNNRVFLLDEKLKTILDVPAGIDLQFTNLQTYLKPHYLGALDAPEAAAPAEEAPAPAAAPAAAPTPKKVVKKVVKKVAA